MKTSLKNSNVTLRKFYIDDAQRLSALCNNIKIWQNVRDTFPFPYKISDAEAFIENCLAHEPTNTFAIEYNEEVVGAIGFDKQTDVYRLSAELGYWVGEPYWGMGIATSAVKLMIDYGFEVLGLVRIYAGVFENNPSSMKVLEKAGFTKECIARKAVIKNGNILDGHRYAIIK